MRVCPLSEVKIVAKKVEIVFADPHVPAQDVPWSNAGLLKLPQLNMGYPSNCCFLFFGRIFVGG
jgi:hypothetical protein